MIGGFTGLIQQLIQGLSLLDLLLYLGGAWACFMYRHLSSKLALTGIGFVGLGLTIGIRLGYSAFAASFGGVRIYWLILVNSILGLGSTSLIVAGLALAFSEVHLRLARAKGPTNDWE